MNDIISGFITKQINDKIIEMNVTEYGRDNIFAYLKNEKINLSLSELLNSSKEQKNINFGDCLDLNRRIVCHVKSRDLNGNIAAKITTDN